ncbi:hypothetical protein LINPERPRIM_LOCUS25435 [Linum perenne]
MEYERIHKVQSGVISPSKLRMKLMGPHHHIRKQQSSNSTSSPTSPPSTVCDDTDFVHNSLLYSDIADPVPEGFSSYLFLSRELFVFFLCLSISVTTATSDPDSARHPKDNINDLDHAKLQQLLRCESVNSTAVHNLRLSEDDNPGYDSSSSFEFQKDRSYAQSHQLTRSFSRPMSSKWNDAEKWIINKQSVQPKKNSFLHNQVNHRTSANMGRVAPELVATSTKLVDFCQTASQVGFENSSFIAPATPSLSGQAYGGNLLIEMDQFSQCTDMKEVDQTTVSTKSLTEDRTGKGVCSLLLS